MENVIGLKLMIFDAKVWNADLEYGQAAQAYHPYPTSAPKAIQSSWNCLNREQGS
jgi:hypothetical protein